MTLRLMERLPSKRSPECSPPTAPPKIRVLTHRKWRTGFSPYEIGTQAVVGFADWNGRSLTDNAPDVMFSLAANTPVHLGVGKESVTSKPSSTFPYVPAVLVRSATS